MTEPLIALILAGERAKQDDPLRAMAPGHKAFIDIAGAPMIARVLSAVESVQGVAEIWISTNEAHRASFQELIRERAQAPGVPKIFIKEAAPSPAATICSHLRALPAGHNLFVTTSDHALLTRAMIREFLGGVDAHAHDLAAACVTRPVFAAAYPDARRTFIKFRDFAFSGANMFWLKRETSAPLIDFWRRLEDNRKHPAKMAREIGLQAGFLYLSGLLTKQRALQILKRKTGVNADLVALQVAEAAIDVDKPEDIALVHSILAQRKLAKRKAAD